jgi:hypothetical protein
MFRTPRRTGRPTRVPHPQARRARADGKGFRPGLEVLESRCLLTTVWSPIGPSPVLDPNNAATVVAGRVNVAVLDPNNDEVMYAGTESGGIWKTGNWLISASPHWVPLSDNQPSLSIDGQSALFGSPFARPLIVTVTDTFGNGVPGVSVAFTTPTSGPGAVLASPTATTDANGQASESVTANGTSGSYSVTAAVAGVAAPAVFLLTNLPATLSGKVFQDININGVQDPGEPGVGGQTVYLDLHGSGSLAPDDPTATTDGDGNFKFTVTKAGTYTLREVLLGGVLLDAPAGASYSLTLGTAQNLTAKNFADVPTSIAVPLTLPLTTPFPSQGNANADYVEALYRSILQRDAEPGGLAFWTGVLNSGVSRQ